MTTETKPETKGQWGAGTLNLRGMDPETVARFKALASFRGKKLGELADEAIFEYLENNPLPK